MNVVRKLKKVEALSYKDFREATERSGYLGW